MWLIVRDSVDGGNGFLRFAARRSQALPERLAAPRGETKTSLLHRFGIELIWRELRVQF